MRFMFPIPYRPYEHGFNRKSVQSKGQFAKPLRMAIGEKMTMFKNPNIRIPVSFHPGLYTHSFISMQPKTHKILSVIFGCICLSGFLFQIHSICIIYFAYDTATAIYINLPDVLQVPDFSWCIRYYDVFDHKGFTEKTGFNYKSPEFKERYSELQQVVTIRDIIEFTPRVEGLCVNCLVRYPNSYTLHDFNGTQCLTQFTIRKYYIQEFICYTFHQSEPSTNATYDYRNIAYSLTYSGVFYGLILNKSLVNTAENCKALIHIGYPDLPVSSITFAPTFNRKFEKATNSAKYNLFHLTYYHITKKLLKPPFTTNCRDYRYELGYIRTSCIDTCYTRTIKEELEKRPFTVIENGSGG